MYQDLALVPQLPVYLNLFLNHELTHFGPLRLLDKRTMRDSDRQYLDDINVNVPNMNAEVGQLSGGQRQAIAVARANEVGRQDPALRRAARRDGSAGVTAHHRPRERASPRREACQ